MTPTKDNIPTFAATAATTATRASTKPSALPGFENEGEGNKTAARRYDAAQEAYVASGKSDAAARAAKEAYDGPEGNALRQAEQLARAQKNVTIEDITDDAELAPSERVTEVDPLKDEDAV